MEKLKPEDLYSLEAYAKVRPEFRLQAIAHKKARRLTVGPHATLFFEDRLTMQYQVQEVLRVERIFELQEIHAELEAYNPLIPDGTNWKATLMIEYEDPEERRVALMNLVDMEHRVWLRIGDSEPVWAIADEDLPRSTEAKTSAVHFLRFEPAERALEMLRAGASLAIGIDHPAYRHAVDPVPENLRQALLDDIA